MADAGKAGVPRYEAVRLLFPLLKLWPNWPRETGPWPGFEGKVGVCGIAGDGWYKGPADMFPFWKVWPACQKIDGAVAAWLL